MHKVYFENSKGKCRKIGEGEDIKQCNKVIFDFLKDHKFKMYYYRTWQTKFRGKNAIKYDVGSHTEFFYVVS